MRGLYNNMSLWFYRCETIITCPELYLLQSWINPVCGEQVTQSLNFITNSNNLKKCIVSKQNQSFFEIQLYVMRVWVTNSITFLLSSNWVQNVILVTFIEPICCNTLKIWSFLCVYSFCFDGYLFFVVSLEPRAFHTLLQRGGSDSRELYAS